jgi:ribosomal protein S18 acetylase RimI-like enzyme
MRTRKEAAVQLAPMSAEEFEKWKPANIADYAKQHTIGGRWTADEAQHKSREEFESLLPQGLATPDHRLYSIVRSTDRKATGMLWIQIQSAPRPASFVFNIEIFKPFRRRGYGTQAMKLLEQEARSLGLENIRLHVFGHNAAARSLYEKLGYVATNIQMTKRLG